MRDFYYDIKIHLGFQVRSFAVRSRVFGCILFTANMASSLENNSIVDLNPKTFGRTLLTIYDHCVCKPK